MKRGYKVIICLVLVAGIISVLLLARRNGSKRAVDTYKRELRAKGEKLSISEVAASLPKYPVEAARAFTNWMQRFQGPANYPPAMSMAAPGLARVAHTNLDAQYILDYPRNVRAASELRKALNGSVLDFQLDYSKGWALPLPALAQLKGAERLASATAIEALQAGDFAEARMDLLTAADLVWLFDNEALLISGLVRASMAHIAFGATWEGLQCDEWTDPQLSELQTRWEGMDLFRLSEASLAMERAMYVDSLAIARKSYEARAAFTFTSTTTRSPGSGGTISTLAQHLRQASNELVDRYPRYWAWKSSWSYEEELYDVQISSAALEASRRTKATGAFAPAFAEFNQETTNICKLHVNGKQHFWSPGQESVLSKYLVRLADAEMARRLLVAAIALKRYRLGHGGYPASLGELVPDYLRGVPTDLMDGKPLRYRLKPDGTFLLYSVGEDGEDNGGDAAWVGRANSINWVAARDAVWPRAASPGEIEDYLNGSQKDTNAVQQSGK